MISVFIRKINKYQEYVNISLLASLVINLSLIHCIFYPHSAQTSRNGVDGVAPVLFFASLQLDVRSVLLLWKPPEAGCKSTS